MKSKKVIKQKLKNKQTAKVDKSQLNIETEGEQYVFLRPDSFAKDLARHISCKEEVAIAAASAAAFVDLTCRNDLETLSKEDVVTLVRCVSSLDKLCVAMEKSGNMAGTSEVTINDISVNIRPFRAFINQRAGVICNFLQKKESSEYRVALKNADCKVKKNNQKITVKSVLGSVPLEKTPGYKLSGTSTDVAACTNALFGLPNLHGITGRQSNVTGQEKHWSEALFPNGAFPKETRGSLSEAGELAPSFDFINLQVKDNIVAHDREGLLKRKYDENTYKEKISDIIKIKKKKKNFLAFFVKSESMKVADEKYSNTKNKKHVLKESADLVMGKQRTFEQVSLDRKFLSDFKSGVFSYGNLQVIGSGVEINNITTGSNSLLQYRKSKNKGVNYSNDYSCAVESIAAVADTLQHVLNASVIKSKEGLYSENPSNFGLFVKRGNSDNRLLEEKEVGEIAELMKLVGGIDIEVGRRNLLSILPNTKLPLNVTKNFDTKESKTQSAAFGYGVKSISYLSESGKKGNADAYGLGAVIADLRSKMLSLLEQVESDKRLMKDKVAFMECRQSVLDNLSVLDKLEIDRCKVLDRLSRILTFGYGWAMDVFNKTEKVAPIGPSIGASDKSVIPNRLLIPRKESKGIEVRNKLISSFAVDRVGIKRHTLYNSGAHSDIVNTEGVEGLNIKSLDVKNHLQNGGAGRDFISNRHEYGDAYKSIRDASTGDVEKVSKQIFAEINKITQELNEDKIRSRITFANSGEMQFNFPENYNDSALQEVLKSHDKKDVKKIRFAHYIAEKTGEVRVLVEKLEAFKIATNSAVKFAIDKQIFNIGGTIGKSWLDVLPYKIKETERKLQTTITGLTYGAKKSNIETKHWMDGSMFEKNSKDGTKHFSVNDNVTFLRDDFVRFDLSVARQFLRSVEDVYIDHDVVEKDNLQRQLKYSTVSGAVALQEDLKKIKNPNHINIKTNIKTKIIDRRIVNDTLRKRYFEEVEDTIDELEDLDKALVSDKNLTRFTFTAPLNYQDDDVREQLKLQSKDDSNVVEKIRFAHCVAQEAGRVRILMEKLEIFKESLSIPGKDREEDDRLFSLSQEIELEQGKLFDTLLRENGPFNKAMAFFAREGDEMFRIANHQGDPQDKHDITLSTKKDELSPSSAMLFLRKIETAYARSDNFKNFISSLELMPNLYKRGEIVFDKDTEIAESVETKVIKKSTINHLLALKYEKEIEDFTVELLFPEKPVQSYSKKQSRLIFVPPSNYQDNKVHEKLKQKFKDDRNIIEQMRFMHYIATKAGETRLMLEKIELFKEYILKTKEDNQSKIVNNATVKMLESKQKDVLQYLLGKNGYFYKAVSVYGKQFKVTKPNGERVSVGNDIIKNKEIFNPKEAVTFFKNVELSYAQSDFFQECIFSKNLTAEMLPSLSMTGKVSERLFYKDIAETSSQTKSNIRRNEEKFPKIKGSFGETVSIMRKKHEKRVFNWRAEQMVGILRNIEQVKKSIGKNLSKAEKLKSKQTTQEIGSLKSRQEEKELLAQKIENDLKKIKKLLTGSEKLRNGISGRSLTANQSSDYVYDSHLAKRWAVNKFTEICKVFETITSEKKLEKYITYTKKIPNKIRTIDSEHIAVKSTVDRIDLLLQECTNIASGKNIEHADKAKIKHSNEAKLSFSMVRNRDNIFNVSSSLALSRQLDANFKHSDYYGDDKKLKELEERLALEKEAQKQKTQTRKGMRTDLTDSEEEQLETLKLTKEIQESEERIEAQKMTRQELEMQMQTQMLKGMQTDFADVTEDKLKDSKLTKEAREKEIQELEQKMTRQELEMQELEQEIAEQETRMRDGAQTDFVDVTEQQLEQQLKDSKLTKEAREKEIQELEQKMTRQELE
nr:hypothetical protein [Rickettsiales bacterium]